MAAKKHPTKISNPVPTAGLAYQAQQRTTRVTLSTTYTPHMPGTATRHAATSVPVTTQAQAHRSTHGNQNQGQGKHNQGTALGTIRAGQSQPGHGTPGNRNQGQGSAPVREEARESTLRLGSRLIMSCMSAMISWLTGILPSSTACRYASISPSRPFSPLSACTVTVAGLYPVGRKVKLSVTPSVTLSLWRCMVAPSLHRENHTMGLKGRGG